MGAGTQKGCYKVGTAAPAEVVVVEMHMLDVEAAAAAKRTPRSLAIVPTTPGFGSDFDSGPDSGPSPNQDSYFPSRSPA